MREFFVKHRCQHYFSHMASWSLHFFNPWREIVEFESLGPAAPSSQSLFVIDCDNLNLSKGTYVNDSCRTLLQT